MWLKECWRYEVISSHYNFAVSFSWLSLLSQNISTFPPVLIYELLYLIISIWVAHYIFFPLILFYGVLLSSSQTPLPFSHDDSFKPMAFSYSYTMAILRESSWEHNTFSLTFLWQFMDKSLLLAQQLNLSFIKSTSMKSNFMLVFWSPNGILNQIQINLVSFSFIDVSYKYLELEPWWL